jgi:hypothetical protein
MDNVSNAVPTAANSVVSELHQASCPLGEILFWIMHREWRAVQGTSASMLTSHLTALTLHVNRTHHPNPHSEGDPQILPNGVEEAGESVPQYAVLMRENTTSADWSQQLTKVVFAQPHCLTTTPLTSTHSFQFRETGQEMPRTSSSAMRKASTEP